MEWNQTSRLCKQTWLVSSVGRALDSYVTLHRQFTIDTNYIYQQIQMSRVQVPYGSFSFYFSPRFFLQTHFQKSNFISIRLRDLLSNSPYPLAVGLPDCASFYKPRQHLYPSPNSWFHTRSPTRYAAWSASQTQMTTNPRAAMTSEICQTSLRVYG